MEQRLVRLSSAEQSMIERALEYYAKEGPRGDWKDVRNDARDLRLDLPHRWLQGEVVPTRSPAPGILVSGYANVVSELV